MLPELKSFQEKEGVIESKARQENSLFSQVHVHPARSAKVVVDKQGDMSSVALKKESYQVAVHLAVAESSSNFESGNIFIRARLFSAEMVEIA